MKIKQTIIDQINNVDSRKRICNALPMSDQMLYKHLSANSDNGRLTKMDALMAISKETGTAVDQLCEESVSVQQN